MGGLGQCLCWTQDNFSVEKIKFYFVALSGSYFCATVLARSLNDTVLVPAIVSCLQKMKV